MPPTIRTGQIATKGTNAIGPDRLVIDMLKRIYEYDPRANPMLTVLTNRAQVMPANATEVKHLEDEPVPEWDKVVGAQTNADTALEVSNVAYHQNGDILLNVRTGEYVRVTAVAAALTVVRGYAGSTALAMNDQDNILNLGTSKMEGDTSSPAKATITATKNNFTEIKEEPVHISRTLTEIDLYGTSDERARLRRKAASKHAREWEQTLLHGKKNEDVSTATNPIRMAGGIDEFITTNVFDAGGTLTETEMIQQSGQVFRFQVDGGNGRKALISGQAGLNSMSSWGAGKLQTQSDASARYGFAISSLITPYGVLDVVYHPLLELGYADRMYWVDLAGIKLRPLHRTTLETNIQPPDEDGFKDRYLTEQSFSFINEKAFAVTKNIIFS